MKLYAARATLKGHSFGKDTEWQRQFEDEFPFQETPDQLASLEEIKKIWNQINQWIDFYVEM